MLEIKPEDEIYRIYKNRIQIGSVEFNADERYIENIYLDVNERGKGHLREIVEYFGKPLIVLHRVQHIDKFRHLGFKLYETRGADNYYIIEQYSAVYPP